MLHAASNDDDDSWGDDNTKDTYTGAKFDDIGEENDRQDSVAEEHYQPHVLRNDPSDGRIHLENVISLENGLEIA